jgi:hypothetical protein
MKSITVTIHEGQYADFIISRTVLRMRNFQTKCLEKIETHFLRSITFFSENPAVYEIMWKNIVERVRPHMTIWRMRIACWMPKATNTQSKYVIRIAFPLQQ